LTENDLDAEELIEHKDNYSCTPLHVATRGGHNEIVRLLIDFGARVDTLNDQDRTPLHTAADLGFIK